MTANETTALPKPKHRPRGRPVLGVLSGLLFGISADLALLSLGVLGAWSVVLVVLPPLFLVLGLVWSLWAPVGRAKMAGRVAAERQAALSGKAS